MSKILTNDFKLFDDFFICSGFLLMKENLESFLQIMSRELYKVNVLMFHMKIVLLLLSLYLSLNICLFIWLLYNLFILSTFFDF